MLENLANLYQEFILEHSRNPRNTGQLPCPPAKKGFGLNASCGDKLVLFVDVQNNIIQSIKHESDGCSIFQASCSMLSQTLIGKTVEETQQILDIYMKLITFDGTDSSLSQDESAILGKLKIFENIRNYPARVKCAALFTRTLQQLLEQEGHEELTVTSEND